MAVKEPQGVEFFSIKTGDNHFLKLEAQIQAYINSSDMGINASRGQDFGWRLAPSWVKKVKQFKKNEEKMERLTSRNGGKLPTTPQILMAIYGEQVRAYEQQVEDEDNPYEENYQKAISNNKDTVEKTQPAPEETEPSTDEEPSKPEK